VPVPRRGRNFTRYGPGGAWAAFSVKGFTIMRSKTIPTDAEVIRTFDELREFRDSFFNGEFHFLLVVGRQGVSKSSEFEERCRPCKDRDGNEFSVAYYVKGNITAPEAYRLSYLHRNKRLVFDDGERLWADRNGRYLLRDLTECKPRKCVSWRADNKAFERQRIPKSFWTRSQVCLIMNRFAFGDALEYEAIVDRGQFIYFDPTALEIHKNTALWFWDQQVFDFIGEHLHIIDHDKLSARTYVKAFERKAKGDWREFIARRYFKQSGEQWVLALESSPNYQSVDERVAEFMRRTGLCRSTYFNYKKSLRTDGQLHPLDVPQFLLTGRPPEVPDLEAEAKAEADEARRRAEQKRIEQQEEQEYRDLEGRFFNDGEDEDGEDDDG
jgi:hypothetical protein